jgi:hypothetical protein
MFPSVEPVRGGTPWFVQRSVDDMRREDEEARHQIELATAELAILKQELVLQQLIDTREPTDEARALLERLRELAETLAGRNGRSAQKKSTGEEAA